MDEQVLGVLVTMLIFGVYFFPTLYSAIVKKQRNFGFAAVFLINAFLGWTGVGWVVAAFLAESLPSGRPGGWV